MYPNEELNSIALRKVVLRRRIARRREECQQLAGEVARPFVLIHPWIMRLAGLFSLARRLWPMLQPKRERRTGLFSLLLKGLPALFRMFSASDRKSP